MKGEQKERAASLLKNTVSEALPFRMILASTGDEKNGVLEVVRGSCLNEGPQSLQNFWIIWGLLMLTAGDIRCLTAQYCRISFGSNKNLPCIPMLDLTSAKT